MRKSKKHKGQKKGFNSGGWRKKRDENQERTSFFALAENAIRPDDLSGDVSVPVDDECGEVPLGIVLDALVADDGDELRAGEPLGEDGEDLSETDRGGLSFK